MDATEKVQQSGLRSEISQDELRGDFSGGQASLFSPSPEFMPLELYRDRGVGLAPTSKGHVTTVTQNHKPAPPSPKADMLPMPTAPSFFAPLPTWVPPAECAGHCLSP